jgi:class 3 adenylate cyclase
MSHVKAVERKLATVLFADLVGSTALGEQEDPERMRVFLERFYDAMAEEISRVGGTVEKFAGDAVMAVFGVPEAHEDHAERALHAAIAMQRRLEALFDGRLALRIGVNTGELVAGRAHEGSSFVTGDAVNVAARLEQAAEPGTIVLGSRTAEAVGGAFELGTPFELDAKGKAAPVAAQRLVRALGLIRPRGIRSGALAFVGRDTELELLRAIYRHAVEQGEPHLVTLMGDAGVGKTTLVRELWRWLADQDPAPLQRTGRCLAYGHVTYWALGEILREQLGILESDAPMVARQRLDTREILGLALGHDVAGDLHPLTVRDQLQETWVDFLSELAGEGPTVVLVEDLHWAEDPLLDLLDRASRDVRGPLVIIGTARPELLDRRPAWGGGRRNASLVWLDALSATESAAMLDQLASETLPSETRRTLVERAEGNPFFLEELLTAYVELGAVADELPDSVQGILAARVDRLAAGEKAALQAASVIGRIFWSGPTRELAGGDPDWTVLEDRDFVRRRAGSSIAGETEYAFKHALTRDVVYASVPKARRARLHAAFAAWLARTCGGRDEQAALLAHHYAAAVDPDHADLAWAGDEAEQERLRIEALSWLRRAAELAWRRYDLDDAIALLHRAVALEPDVAAQAAMWHEIGHTSALRYDGEAFVAAMERSLETCTDRAVCADSYAELALQTSVRSSMWKRRPAEELVESWIRQALELSEPESRARAKGLIARAVWSESEEAAREAGELAQRLGDVELRSLVLSARQIAAACGHSYRKAWTLAQRRFDLVPELDDPDHVYEIHESGALASLGVGRFREARRLAVRSDELAARLSVHHRMHGIGLRVEAEELAGNWVAIRALTPVAEEAVAANLDTPCTRNARTLLVCALASQHAGDKEEARRLETKADELELEGYEYSEEPLRLHLALARGERPVVGPPIGSSGGRVLAFGLSHLSARLDALAAARDREAVEALAAELLEPTTYLEPFALRALGIVRDDEELLARAVARFEAMGIDWHAEETRRLIGSFWA